MDGGMFLAVKDDGLNQYPGRDAGLFFAVAEDGLSPSKSGTDAGLLLPSKGTARILRIRHG